MLDLLVIGAGPTGLTAAAEAVRHGLSVRIVDSNAQRSIHSKALVLHSRSLEIFADMGLANDVIAYGQEFRALNVYMGGKKLSRVDFRKIDWQDAIYPYWLSIPQSDTERFLEAHLAKLGVQVERYTQLTGLKQYEDRVQASLTLLNDEGDPVGNELVEAAWIIGADGARSTTRKLSDISFEGTAEDELFVLGDVTIDWDEPEDEGQNFMSSEGILLIVPLPELKQYRIIAHMPTLAVADVPEITLDFLQQLVDQRTNMEAKVTDLVWQSSFSVKHLVAAHHRLGRLFLAGDAAHIHSPVGGQGLNTGIQDAYNLLWKLALVQHGKGSELLLDSYEAERHEVAEATIKKVSFATSLVTVKNPISRTLRNQLAAILINTDVVQNRFGRDVGMLDISYQNSPIVAEDFGKAKSKRPSLRKNGSKGPIPGERAPNVLFLDEQGVSHSLVDYLRGERHKLLLFTDQQDHNVSLQLRQIKELIDSRFADFVDTYLVTSSAPLAEEWAGPIIINQDGAIHRRYGVTEAALYLCRPDQHIAYRNRPVQPELFSAYLKQVFN